MAFLAGIWTYFFPPRRQEQPPATRREFQDLVHSNCRFDGVTGQRLRRQLAEFKPLGGEHPIIVSAGFFGVGKSYLLNAIATSARGRPVKLADARASHEHVTTRATRYNSKSTGLPATVVDIPGTEDSSEYKKYVRTIKAVVLGQVRDGERIDIISDAALRAIEARPHGNKAHTVIFHVPVKDPDARYAKAVAALVAALDGIASVMVALTKCDKCIERHEDVKFVMCSDEVVRRRKELARHAGINITDIFPTVSYAERNYPDTAIEEICLKVAHKALSHAEPNLRNR